MWAVVFFLRFDTLCSSGAQVRDLTDTDALDVPPWSQTGWIILLVRHHPMGPSWPSPWQRRRKSPSHRTEQQMWEALSADAKL